MAAALPQVVGKNCIEMGVLVEDNNAGPNTTKLELDQWVLALKTPNTWVLNSMGSQPEMEAYFNTPRDFWMIVDLSTMKILQQSNDNGPQAIMDLETMCN
jgi:hypothetical protein